MFTFQRACFAAGLAVLLSACAHALQIGAQLPAQQFERSQGDLQPLFVPGKITVVDFWASWCTPCRKSFPFWNALQAKHPEHLRIVGLNVDEQRADAAAFLKRTPAHFLLLFDPKGQAATQFDVKVMPSSFALDGSGKVLWVHRGFRSSEQPKMRNELEALLAERTLSAKEK